MPESPVRETRIWKPVGRSAAGERKILEDNAECRATDEEHSKNPAVPVRSLLLATEQVDGPYDYVRLFSNYEQFLACSAYNGAPK